MYCKQVWSFHYFILCWLPFETIIKTQLLGVCCVPYTTRTAFETDQYIIVNFIKKIEYRIESSGSSGLFWMISLGSRKRTWLPLGFETSVRRWSIVIAGLLERRRSRFICSRKVWTFCKDVKNWTPKFFLWTVWQGWYIMLVDPFLIFEQFVSLIQEILVVRSPSY